MLIASTVELDLMADFMYANVMMLDDKVTELKTLVKQLLLKWQGDAAEAFREEFEAYLSYVESCIETLRDKHIKALRDTAKNYEDAERRNIASIRSM